MLNIEKKAENGKAVMHLSGELDTLTAEDLSREADGFLEGITDFTLDLDGLAYVTSAGLRIILSMGMIMENQGQMKVIHVCEDVMDVFEVTGFTEAFEIG